MRVILKENILQQLRKSDYILIKKENTCDQLRASDVEVLRGVLRDYSKDTIISSVSVPMDNSIIMIYRNYK